jgi:hypothetical protein
VLLRAWARQLEPEPYAEGLALETLGARWSERRASLALPTLAKEINAVGHQLRPAWIPDETWPHGYHEMRRLRVEAEYPGCRASVT